MSLRIVYCGTPDFAVPALEALARLDDIAGESVELVAAYTQPDRPAGRGKKLTAPPVKQAALELGLPVEQPLSLRDEEAQATLAAYRPDLLVVAAYGLILPQAVLDLPRFGAINIHASLLPRWRGAAPINRAIEAGDAETGITIMQMDEGLDTGDMLLWDRVPITGTTTASGLHDQLAAMGAHLLVEALGRLEQGTLTTTPQAAEGATYAHKLTREDGQLDWRRSAHELERQVRALTPWPGAWFLHGETVLKVSAAEVVRSISGPPGEVLDERLTIACGADAFRPALIQRPGKAPMPAEQLLRGYDLPPGTMLPLPKSG